VTHPPGRKPIWGFFVVVLLGYLVAFIAGDLLGIPPLIAIKGDRFRSELDASAIVGALLGLMSYWLWWRRD